MTTVYIDISSTLRLPFVSGVQRLTRELTRRLVKTKRDIVFKPLDYCPACGMWRNLDGPELTRRLDSPCAPSQRRPSLARIAGNVNRALFGESIAGRLHSRLRKHLRRCQHGRDGMFRQIPAGSVFLDMDSAWHALRPRSELLPQLTRNRVTVMNVHYDIIPLLYPNWVHPHTVHVFERFLDAHLQYSKLFICISSKAEQDLQGYCARHGHSQKLPTSCLQLGADLPTSGTPKGAGNARLPDPALRLILSVGTIEPRKNHDLLLGAFDRLCHRYPDIALVIVGRQGWMAEPIARRIRRHRLFGQRLIWLPDATDVELDALYEHADLCLIPSFYEGLGLPVQEALAHGLVTLSSRAGALPEAGREYADYFDPSDQDQLTDLLDGYLGDAERLATRQGEITNFVAPRWEHTVQHLIRILRTHSANPAPESGPATP